MKQARNFKEAAQRSLEERWYPIRDAKNIEEMFIILNNANCELCALQNRRYFGYCGRCPLHKSGHDKATCCKIYQNWYTNATPPKPNYKKAHKAATIMCKLLEKIAEGK